MLSALLHAISCDGFWRTSPDAAIGKGLGVGCRRYTRVRGIAIFKIEIRLALAFSPTQRTRDTPCSSRVSAPLIKKHGIENIITNHLTSGTHTRTPGSRAMMESVHINGGLHPIRELAVSVSLNFQVICPSRLQNENAWDGRRRRRSRRQELTSSSRATSSSGLRRRFGAMLFLYALR